MEAWLVKRETPPKSVVVAAKTSAHPVPRPSATFVPILGKVSIHHPVSSIHNHLASTSFGRLIQAHAPSFSLPTPLQPPTECDIIAPAVRCPCSSGFHTPRPVLSCPVAPAARPSLFRAGSPNRLRLLLRSTRVWKVPLLYLIAHLREPDKRKLSIELPVFPPFLRARAPNWVCSTHRFHCVFRDTRNEHLLSLRPQSTCRSRAPTLPWSFVRQFPQQPRPRYHETACVCA